MTTKAIRSGRAEIEIGVRDRLKRDLAKARKRLNRFAASVDQVGKKLTKFSAGLGAGFGLATHAFASFDDQMRLVGALANSTDKEFQGLSDTAAKLGRTTSFTASQVASAMVSLARAGFDYKR